MTEQEQGRWQHYRFGQYREVHYGREWQGQIIKACTDQPSKIHGRRADDWPVTCRKCIRAVKVER